jgi:hypothetical protein
MITRCCSQPLHRDRTRRQEFFPQEIIDLFILAHSRKIIAGFGGFAVLGRYWLGRDGPEMEVVKTKEEVRSQMERIRWESDCANKELDHVYSSRYIDCSGSIYLKGSGLVSCIGSTSQVDDRLVAYKDQTISGPRRDMAMPKASEKDVNQKKGTCASHFSLPQVSVGATKLEIEGFKSWELQQIFAFYPSIIDWMGFSLRFPFFQLIFDTACRPVTLIFFCHLEPVNPVSLLSSGCQPSISRSIIWITVLACCYFKL